MVYSEKVCGVYKQVAYGEEYIMWCIVRKCVVYKQTVYGEEYIMWCIVRRCVVCISRWCVVRNTLCSV